MLDVRLIKKEICESLEEYKKKTYICNEDINRIKCNVRESREKHSKSSKACWMAIEDEILKNLNISENRVKVIEDIRNDTRKLQDQIADIQVRGVDMKKQVVELQSIIDQKKSLLNQQMSYIEGRAPLPKKDYSPEDKIVIVNEQALLDCVKYSTRIKWDMEAPENLLRGYTFDHVKLTVQPFAEKINLKNKKQNQELLWEKLEAMRSYDWPDLNYELDDIGQTTK